MERKIFNFESKISDDETMKEYGYLPSLFGQSSAKFVIATCRFCGKFMPIRKGFFNKAGSACHNECRFEEMKKSGSPFSDPKIREKAKKKNIERYGTEFASQNKDIANKISDTKKTIDSKEKTAKTNVERYGVVNVFQSEEIKEKIKQTNFEKYGVDHPQKNEEIRKKTTETIIERYGTNNVMKNDDVKKRGQETNKTRYGHTNPLQNSAIKEKQKQTMLERYGACTPIQNKEIYNKIVATNIIRYGFPVPSQNEDIKAKVKDAFKNTVEEDINGNFKMINILRDTEIWEMMKKHKMSLSEICDELSINYGSLTFQLSTDEFKTKYLQNYSFPKNQTQKKISNMLKEFYNGPIITNDRKAIGPFELDIYLPEKSFAIEYNGSLWHSEFFLTKTQARKKHRLKLELCRKNGIRLFNIFENTWEKRDKQILNLIRSILGGNDKKIGARECVITDDDCKDFIDNNHIQGYGNGTIKYFNLAYNGEIVASMTASAHHRQNITGNPIILNRLCFKDGINVQGGATKLFKHFLNWSKNSGYDSILSWSDSCWTEGNIYSVLGFSLIKEYDPDYFYWNSNGDRGYLSKQSQKKSNTGCPKDKTEREWCLERGLYRIWDCGKKLWKYNLV